MFAADPSTTLALVFASIGSFSMGSYPVPIKSPSVLEANVHPLVFQCYKSFWVFTFGLLFIIANVLRNKPAYQFTYWGLLGAAAWVPSGLGCIAAVPRLGIGMTMVLVTGTSATGQFFVGQMAGETMDSRAPWYLAAVILGMVGLVMSPILTFSKTKPAIAVGDQESQMQSSLVSAVALLEPSRARQIVEGIAASFISGIFSALIFGLLTFGKKYESQRTGDPACTGENGYKDCPEWFKDAFDPFGSYMVTFGIGAALTTTLFMGIFATREASAGRPMPESHFGVLKVLGSIAGWCWVLGNVFQTAAVDFGGASVAGPANQAIQLITSGAWGIVYYREVKHPVRIIFWVLSAAWTVTFVILLGGAKE